MPSRAEHFPLLLDATKARRYLGVTCAEFRAMQHSGRIPGPRRVAGAAPKWSRRELDRIVDQIFEMEAEDASAADKEQARAGLDAIKARLRAEDHQRRR